MLPWKGSESIEGKMKVRRCELEMKNNNLLGRIAME